VTSLPARDARIRAGLDTATAARQLRVSVPYLLQAEREGFSYVLAVRAAQLYRARLDDFLPVRAGKGDGSPARAKRGAGAGRSRNRPAPSGT
jgi:hypothetical protein